MKIVGCDLHTRYQQIAMLDAETGELTERRLEHESGQARAFYAGLKGAVRVGIEATGHTRWFERMLAELGHELWIGDAAQIRAAMVRKQKTDVRDAAHLLELLLSERFPRIWRPTMAERDRRQLVWHHPFAATPNVGAARPFAGFEEWENRNSTAARRTEMNWPSTRHLALAAASLPPGRFS